MIQRPTIYSKRWRLLGDRHASELAQAWDKTTSTALALYAELRRRNSLDEGPGYPTTSGGGGGGKGEMSNRPLEIVIRQDEGTIHDPIRELLGRGEAMLYEYERQLAAWVSQVQNLPAIDPPEFRPRDVCVDCGGSPWIVGKLENSRCRDCERRQRTASRRLQRKR